MYNKDNFFSHTKANFLKCKAPDRTPDFISNSGSKYWYGCDASGDFVIRNSNHWSNSKNFFRRRKPTDSVEWSINKEHNNITIVFALTGKAYFKDFEEIIETMDVSYKTYCYEINLKEYKKGLSGGYKGNLYAVDDLSAIKTILARMSDDSRKALHEDHYSIFVWTKNGHLSKTNITMMLESLNTKE